MKNNRKFAPKFSVVSIDAQEDGDNGWDWNETHKLFEFRTTSLDLKRAFLGRLRHYLQKGVRTVSGLRHSEDLGRGWYYVTDDWNIMELRRRCDDCPYYACIRESH